MGQAKDLRTGVAAIGPLVDIAGFGLVGVMVRAAETAEEARAAWAALPESAGIVILAAGAAAALSPPEMTQRLTVVMPT